MSKIGDIKEIVFRLDYKLTDRFDLGSAETVTRPLRQVEGFDWKALETGVSDV